MGVLIFAFIVLLLVLTGTFLGALGIVGWLVLALLGAAILYLPIQSHLEKADERRAMKRRAQLGYGTDHTGSKRE